MVLRGKRREKKIFTSANNPRKPSSSFIFISSGKPRSRTVSLFDSTWRTCRRSARLSLALGRDDRPRQRDPARYAATRRTVTSLRSFGTTPRRRGIRREKISKDIFPRPQTHEHSRRTSNLSPPYLSRRGGSVSF